MKPLGPTGIRAWALKDRKNVLMHLLTYLFNAFLREEKFSSDLKKANITPFFKIGDRTHPENCRPISISSSLSKSFKRLLRDQIVEFLLKNNVHSRTQFGFRSKISTMDALVYSTENFRYLIEQYKYVTTALLSKAFDSINHKILILKLREAGFSTSAEMLILVYLSDRLQKTKANSIESDWIQLHQGVPQGTILGPLLFNLYINDLRLKIPNDCQLVQYADDTLTFRSNHLLLNAESDLEKALTLFIDYYKMLSLTLNASKTEFIFFVKNLKLSIQLI